MSLRFAGYAALFGKRDAGGDVIRPGAFARTLSEQRQPIPLFWQHSPEQRIGWVERASEDAKGLRVIATIDNPDGGAGAALKQGKANGLSFGYRARGFVRDSAGRVLSDIQLFEVSLVTHPMQHAARVHLMDDAAGLVREWKFNQRHYRENGQFARAGEGVFYGGGASNSETARLGPVSDFINWIRGEPSPKQRSTQAPKATRAPSPTPSPASVPRRNYAAIGQLSAKHESWGKGDPGMVSSGLNDPGGVSYGKHQYSTTGGIAAQFAQSPEASRWASDFRGLRPGTPQFSAKWREVAARDPDGFGRAQDAFTGRTHYDDKVQGILRQTGLDLDRTSIAVQQAAFSVSVQHGGAEQILREAVASADRQLRRSNSSYEAALINSIYDQRTQYVARLRDNALAKGHRGRAQTFDNIIKNRYPVERRDALRLLAASKR